MTEAFALPASRWFGARPSSPGRAALIEAADEIVAHGLWCVVEVCLDIASQRWERRLVIFRRDGAGVADAVADWVRLAPGQDVRLNGCHRHDLRLAAGEPTHLCYLAGVEELAA